MANIQLYDEDFIARTRKLKETLDKLNQEAWEEEAKRASIPTNKNYIETRLDGYDYVKEHIMRATLSKYFPGWSWIKGESTIITSSFPIWIQASGTLKILSTYLLSLGAPDPFRYFFSLGAARVMYQKEETIKIPVEVDGKTYYKDKKVLLSNEARYKPWNIIDIDKVSGAANTNAFKRAVQRLTSLFSDVYNKRNDEELLPSQLRIINQIKEEHPYLKEIINLNLSKVNPSNFDDFIKQIKKKFREK